jgi:hypothetical protein
MDFTSREQGYREFTNIPFNQASRIAGELSFHIIRVVAGIGGLVLLVAGAIF